MTLLKGIEKKGMGNSGEEEGAKINTRKERLAHITRLHSATRQIEARLSNIGGKHASWKCKGRTKLD